MRCVSDASVQPVKRTCRYSRTFSMSSLAASTAEDEGDGEAALLAAPLLNSEATWYKVRTGIVVVHGCAATLTECSSDEVASSVCITCRSHSCSTTGRTERPSNRCALVARLRTQRRGKQRPSGKSGTAATRSSAVEAGEKNGLPRFVISHVAMVGRARTDGFSQ